MYEFVMALPWLYSGITVCFVTYLMFKRENNDAIIARRMREETRDLLEKTKDLEHKHSLEEERWKHSFEKEKMKRFALEKELGKPIYEEKKSVYFS